MNKKIFLSHSSKDSEIVNSFMENILIGALNIPIEDIFNTSGIGTGIEPGKDWREEINKKFGQSNLIILFISKNYKESEICLNEMGAAWINNKQVIPVLIEPMNYDNVGVLSTKQIEKVFTGQGLDRIKDSIVDRLDMDANKLKTERWTIKRTIFLTDVEIKYNFKKTDIELVSDSSKFYKEVDTDEISSIERNLKDEFKYILQKFIFQNINLRL